MNTRSGNRWRSRPIHQHVTDFRLDSTVTNPELNKSCINAPCMGLWLIGNGTRPFWFAPKRNVKGKIAEIGKGRKDVEKQFVSSAGKLLHSICNAKSFKNYAIKHEDFLMVPIIKEPTKTRVAKTRSSDQVVLGKVVLNAIILA